MMNRSRSRQYKTCAVCGCDVLDIEAVNVGIDPETDEQVFLCEECDEDQEEE